MPRKPIGVRRHGAGWQVYVKVHGITFCEQFPYNTPVAELKEWRRKTRDDYLRRHPKSIAGTLRKNVEVYLRTLAHKPKLQAERATQLAWWVARFGHRRRGSIRRDEWMTALAELAATPIVKGRGTRLHEVPRSASSVRHYRTAMFHLFTTLDGKDAPNPFRDIPPPTEPDAEPRALPFPLIERLLGAMPVEKHRAKLTPEQVRGVRLRLANRESPSAIGRSVGVSEAAIRKIRDAADDRTPEAAKAEARARVMAYTGLPPAQVKQLRPSHVDWDAPSVLVQRRKKGRGTHTVRLPLIPQAVSALQRFFAVHADGAFSTASLGHSFRRAIPRLVDQVAATDWRAAAVLHRELAHATLYDLRHSFLTQFFLTTGDIRSTQAMAMHADIRMTHRYTLAAVDPRLQQAMAAFSEALPAALPIRPT